MVLANKRVSRARRSDFMKLINRYFLINLIVQIAEVWDI